jgi:hypothetical protein
VDEADRLGTRVAVVTAYEMADRWVDLSTVVVPTEVEVRWELQRGAEAMVDEVLAERRGAYGDHASEVGVVVTAGPAADVLLRCAADAELPFACSPTTAMSLCTCASSEVARVVRLPEPAGRPAQWTGTKGGVWGDRSAGGSRRGAATNNGAARWRRTG